MSQEKWIYLNLSTRHEVSNVIMHKIDTWWNIDLDADLKQIVNYLESLCIKTREVLKL